MFFDWNRFLIPRISFSRPSFHSMNLQQISSTVKVGTVSCNNRWLRKWKPTTAGATCFPFLWSDKMKFGETRLSGSLVIGCWLSCVIYMHHRPLSFPVFPLSPVLASYICGSETNYSTLSPVTVRASAYGHQQNDIKVPPHPLHPVSLHSPLTCLQQQHRPQKKKRQWNSSLPSWPSSWLSSLSLDPQWLILVEVVAGIVVTMVVVAVDGIAAITVAAAAGTVVIMVVVVDGTGDTVAADGGKWWMANGMYENGEDMIVLQCLPCVPFNTVRPCPVDDLFFFFFFLLLFSSHTKRSTKIRFATHRGVFWSMNSSSSSPFFSWLSISNSPPSGWRNMKPRDARKMVRSGERRRRNNNTKEYADSSHIPASSSLTIFPHSVRSGWPHPPDPWTPSFIVLCMTLTFYSTSHLLFIPSFNAEFLPLVVIIDLTCPSTVIKRMKMNPDPPILCSLIAW